MGKGEGKTTRRAARYNNRELQFSADQTVGKQRMEATGSGTHVAVLLPGKPTTMQQRRDCVDTWTRSSAHGRRRAQQEREQAQRSTFDLAYDKADTKSNVELVSHSLHGRGHWSETKAQQQIRT